MEPTQLLYLTDLDRLRSDAIVVDIVHENDTTIIVLDQTPFYPQGGGQPYDTGLIEGSDGKFIVEDVRFVDGVVLHKGKFQHGAFNKNDRVSCVVDQERRDLHSRLHSAGHVVDMAVVALNFNFIPSKGYHFPDGPYVEYGSEGTAVDKEKIKTDIEQMCNQIIGQGGQTELILADKANVAQLCKFVPDNIPSDKPTRVVRLGDFGVPCGGTHVKKLADIKSMIVRKIKVKGNKIRVAYDVAK